MPKKLKNATKRFIRTLIITFISNFLIGFNIAFVDYIKNGVIDKKIMIATIIIAPIVSGIIAALDKWLRYEEDETYRDTVSDEISEHVKNHNRKEQDRTNKINLKENRYQEDLRNDRNKEDELHNNLK